MAVWKVREYVSGVYEYEMPLDENMLASVNEYIMKHYGDQTSLITLDEMIAIAEGDFDCPRWDEKLKIYYKFGDEMSYWEQSVGELVWDMLAKDAWDYQVGDFYCDDTTWVEREVVHNA